MSNFIIFILLFFIVLSLFLRASRAFFRQQSIRRSLKRAKRNYKQEIQVAKGNKQQQYEVYRRVYEEALRQKKSFRTYRKRQRYEQQLNDELNRMVKNPFTSLFSWLVVWLKGGVSLFALFWLLVFGSIVVDEYKAADLTLPTVNLDIELKRDIDVEDSISHFLQSVFQQNSTLPKFDLAGLSNEEIVPHYMVRNHPEAVMTAEQLGQALVYNMSSFESKFTIYYTGETKEFEQAIYDAWDWLEQHEVYLSRVRRESSWQYIDYGSHVELQVVMNYDLTAEQNAMVLGKIDQIIQVMPDNLTDIEKVKYVNDYIVVHTKYNLNSQESPYTPYSILLNGEGVCEGYALTALLMLDKLGVETKYVSGNVLPDGLHAWNLVKIEGEWYHLDTTWNDPVPDQGNNVRYDYFLLADKEIAKDHDWIRENYPATAASSY